MAIIRLICTFLLPPLGVFLKVGLDAHFWINIILTLMGYLPGLIHGIYIFLKK